MPHREKRAWIRLVVAVLGYVVYLGFVLSAVLAGVTKVVVYRRSMPAW